MASPDPKTFEILEAFTRYLKSKDMSLISDFSREEIEIALLPSDGVKSLLNRKLKADRVFRDGIL